VNVKGLVGATIAPAPDNIATLERKFIHASPEVKQRLSRYIERGRVGSQVKRALGFKCQICEALGRQPLGFLKTNGEPYVEAHHVMPVSERQVGSLAVSNIMVVCANHHRQMHYGGINVEIGESTFDFTIEERMLNIRRCGLEPGSD
jgi:predicted restriction endonuclease